MSGYGWIRLEPGQLLSQVEADPLHDNPAGPSLCSITLASIVLTSWQILFLGTNRMMCWPATPSIRWPLMMVLVVLIALMDLLWTSHGPHVPPSWPCIQWHGIQWHPKQPRGIPLQAIPNRTLTLLISASKSIWIKPTSWQPLNQLNWTDEMERGSLMRSTQCDPLNPLARFHSWPFFDLTFEIAQHPLATFPVTPS